MLAGYALMHLLRDAPAASAGVTAVILGLPGLALFLTIDVDDVPPFSIELLLGLPALVWGVSYLVGPGRGRPVLLGFALVFAWLFVLQVVEDPFASGGIDNLVEPGVFDESPVPDEFDEEFGDPGFDDEITSDGDAFSVTTSGPDATTIGWISVLFGAGYLALARRFDKRQLAGAATPFVVAGHAALIAGIVLLADDLKAAGVGIAFVLAGIVVARLGRVEQATGDDDHRRARDRVRRGRRHRRRDGRSQRHQLRHGPVRGRGGDRRAGPGVPRLDGRAAPDDPRPVVVPPVVAGPPARRHDAGRRCVRTVAGSAPHGRCVGTVDGSAPHGRCAGTLGRSAPHGRYPIAVGSTAGREPDVRPTATSRAARARAARTAAARARGDVARSRVAARAPVPRTLAAGTGRADAPGLTDAISPATSVAGATDLAREMLPLGQRPLTTSTIRRPASVGFRPTSAPAARRASIFAWAVPLPPETMAPAWPIFLPGGAVTPAM